MPSVGIAATTTYLYDVHDERIAEGANSATTTYPFTFYNVATSNSGNVHKAHLRQWRGRSGRAAEHHDC
jgi:hypothetical protein